MIKRDLEIPKITSGKSNVMSLMYFNLEMCLSYTK